MGKLLDFGYENTNPDFLRGSAHAAIPRFRVNRSKPGNHFPLDSDLGKTAAETF